MTNAFDSDRLKFNVSFGKRVTFFICAACLCLLLCGVITAVIVRFKGMTPPVMRICAVIQDVLVFIVPAVLTAVLITQLPARFLEIEIKPPLLTSVFACLVLIVSIPTMDAVVAWNESITLPESLASLEESMRAAEENARESIGLLLGGESVGALIVAILIVGVLAGLSEEIFFRGTLQRLLATGGFNAHVAIWLTAFVFSATHLQFYGFFGRLLLGAYFGYLLYWTRSLWIPVIVHIVNNTLYILGERFFGEATTAGSEGSVWLLAGSVALTIFGIIALRRYSLKRASSL